MIIPHARFSFCEVKISTRSFETQMGASFVIEVCDLDTGNESICPLRLPGQLNTVSPALDESLQSAEPNS